MIVTSLQGFCRMLIITYPFTLSASLNALRTSRKLCHSSPFADNRPCFDLVRRVCVLLHGLVQMHAHEEMHNEPILHKM